MQIISRSVAKASGAKRYFTGKPCCNGHVAERITATCHCVECQEVSKDKWLTKNPEKRKEVTKKYRDENREERLAYDKKWRLANLEKARELSRNSQKRRYAMDPQKVLEINRKWKAANPEKAAELRRKWHENNRGRSTAIKARYHAQKLKATPPWLTQGHLAEIAAIYTEAQRLTETTGILHHVDHIMPLQGETVCGLHVPWNLRAIPAVVNLSKNNKIFEEMALAA